MEGDFPLHQAVLQTYVHTGLADGYRDSWAAVQCDWQSCASACVDYFVRGYVFFTKIQSVALLLQVYALAALCWYILGVLLTWNNDPHVDNSNTAEKQGKSERRHRWKKGREEKSSIGMGSLCFAAIIFLLWLIFIWSSPTSKATFAL